jgi:DNA replication protein DnaD
LAKENTTITATLKIDFHPIRYDVFNNDILLLSKSYSYKMTESEISRMVNISIKETFESIKSLSSNGIS